MVVIPPNEYSVELGRDGNISRPLFIGDRRSRSTPKISLYCGIAREPLTLSGLVQNASCTKSHQSPRRIILPPCGVGGKCSKGRQHACYWQRNRKRGKGTAGQTAAGAFVAAPETLIAQGRRADAPSTKKGDAYGISCDDC